MFTTVSDTSEHFTTIEFALHQRCQAQTVRKNYCLLGHHHGIKPTKLPSGRLLWRKSDLEELLRGRS